MDKTDAVASMGPVVETKDIAVKNNRVETSPKGNQPETIELKQHGYLALARGLGSGIYEAAGLPSPLISQASDCLELMGRKNGDHMNIASGNSGDDIRSLRQSSIDTEPQTLNLISVRRAKDGAVEIIEAHDEEEAMHLFLKDADNECLREEALAAVLPTSEELDTVLGSHKLHIIPEIKHIRVLNNMAFDSSPIPAGWQHMFALDTAGRLHGWGWNKVLFSSSILKNQNVAMWHHKSMMPRTALVVSGLDFMQQLKQLPRNSRICN